MLCRPIANASPGRVLLISHITARVCFHSSAKNKDVSLGRITGFLQRDLFHVLVKYTAAH